MKIALLTLGTRGDVQPYLCLGKAFKEQGHEVTISTGRNFQEMVRSYGIDFIPVEADFRAFLESDAGKKVIRMPFGATRNLRNWVYPMITDALCTFYEIACESDKVLFNVKTLADHFADQFPEKMIKANVVPTLQPTSEFVNPAFKSLLLPSFLNRLSYKLYDMSIKMMRSQIREFRKRYDLPRKYEKPELPSIYGISSHFLRKPKDFPVNSHFTGFWSDMSSEELPDDIQEFIDEGKPPLLITFGSMPFDSKMNLGLAIKRMVRELDTRVILAKGWGITATESLENDPNIKIIEGAPFEKLLPRVKAVIHHGGAGTTSTCLLSGVPFMTCPVLYPLGDQEFWGTVAYQKGVALKPTPLKKLKEKTLLSMSRELLESDHLYRNSRLLMTKLKKEDGVLGATRIVSNMSEKMESNKSASEPVYNSLQ